MQDYYNSDELMHYGRKGMKWGQNIFGKVKSGAGKVKAKIDDRIERKKRIKADRELRKKPLSQLTDAELKERFSRLQMERNVRDLQNQTGTTSAGKSFVQAAAKQVVGPAMVTAGKSVLTKWFEAKGMDMLGLNKANPFEDLKKDYDKIKLERDISDNKRRIKENEEWFNNPKRNGDDSGKGGSPKKEKAKSEPKPESKPKSDPEPEVRDAPKPKAKKEKKKKKQKPYVMNENDYSISSSPVSSASNTSAYRLGESYIRGFLPG